MPGRARRLSRLMKNYFWGELIAHAENKGLTCAEVGQSSPLLDFFINLLKGFCAPISRGADNTNKHGAVATLSVVKSVSCIKHLSAGHWGTVGLLARKGDFL